ncbi:hypothetical protein GCM10010421_26700 [Streptomyces glaucus]|uniref:Secreted protein n=1 Tax=Streptomyces glaucus TaxID=284029 RepID=A0ABN3JNR5_9ACTN
MPIPRAAGPRALPAPWAAGATGTAGGKGPRRAAPARVRAYAAGAVPVAPPPPEPAAPNVPAPSLPPPPPGGTAARCYGELRTPDVAKPPARVLSRSEEMTRGGRPRASSGQGEGCLTASAPG